MTRHRTLPWSEIPPAPKYAPVTREQMPPGIPDQLTDQNSYALYRGTMTVDLERDDLGTERRSVVSGEILIGRSPKCDLVIPVRAVSGRHLRLVRVTVGKEHGWYAEVLSDNNPVHLYSGHNPTFRVSTLMKGPLYPLSRSDCLVLHLGEGKVTRIFVSCGLEY